MLKLWFEPDPRLVFLNFSSHLMNPKIIFSPSKNTDDVIIEKDLIEILSLLFNKTLTY